MMTGTTLAERPCIAAGKMQRSFAPSEAVTKSSSRQPWLRESVASQRTAYGWQPSAICLYEIPGGRPRLRRSCALFCLVVWLRHGVLAKQGPAKVQDVVGQRAPQRHALDLVQAAHRELRQAAITS